MCVRTNNNAYIYTLRLINLFLSIYVYVIMHIGLRVYTIYELLCVRIHMCICARVFMCCECVRVYMQMNVMCT